VGLGDAEVGPEERDGPGAHRGPAAGAHGQQAAFDLLLVAGVGEERCREWRALAALDVQRTA